jgi:hypothetical protein
VAKRATTAFEDIAAEAGRLFGTTEAHARRWLEQRNGLVEALQQVRERANELIDDLSGQTKRRQMKRRARAAAVKTQIPPGNPAETRQVRKKRRLSAATRAKMRAAAKRRWAARKKSASK